MISSPTTLPFVIIFERHWDQEPKKALKDLIPKLSDEGYDTLCFEFPQSLTEEEIISSHLKGLDFDIKLNSQAYAYVERAGVKDIQLCDLGFTQLAKLMRVCVSSQRYIEVAEKLKGLPSSILLKDLLSNAKKLHFSIKGVDDAQSLQDIQSADLSKRMSVIKNNEERRITTIFENLLNLHKGGKNIVFVCGALHAKNLMNKFEEQNLQDHVLFYFPHSNKSYDENFDDVKNLSKGTLENHTFCLIDEQSRNLLNGRIIKEMKSKNVNYKEEVVGGNSHSRFLSHFFNKNFKAYLRPGYYVDALLDTFHISDCEGIVKKLEEVAITTESVSLEGRTHLVIRDVNTKEIADNIRRLN